MQYQFKMEEGECWCVLHANPQSDVESAKCLMNEAIEISDEKPEEKPLIYRTVEG